MTYKHILVAIDIAEPSDKVIAKSVSLAKNIDAKISFVTVDISHLDADVIDYSPSEVHIIEEKCKLMKEKLDELLSVVEYPIENKMVVVGDVDEKLVETVNKINADLLVTGHHHGFWNRWWSSARKLVNIATGDLLLVHL